MFKFWQIVGRELKAYFTTWTGYIVIAAALIIDGILFNAFAVSGEPKLSSEVLSDFFYFASGMAMISGVFLAMRLVAEERQTGTISLLYSSPVSERMIIYGKFMSAVLFSMVLHFASLYMPALIMIHGKISGGHLFAGYLCLILLGCTTISITLLSSALASNQLVAAVGGAFLTVVLLVLWMLAKVVEPPFRDLLSWLSLHSDHFTPFSNGVVGLKDVVFYLGLTFFFLECATTALEGRRSRG